MLAGCSGDTHHVREGGMKYVLDGRPPTIPFFCMRNENPPFVVNSPCCSTNSGAALQIDVIVSTYCNMLTWVCTKSASLQFSWPLQDLAMLDNWSPVSRPDDTMMCKMHMRWIKQIFQKIFVADRQLTHVPAHAGKSVHYVTCHPQHGIVTATFFPKATAAYFVSNYKIPTADNDCKISPQLLCQFETAYYCSDKDCAPFDMNAHWKRSACGKRIGWAGSPVSSQQTRLTPQLCWQCNFTAVTLMNCIRSRL